jgi:hypothetical protein
MRMTMVTAVTAIAAACAPAVRVQNPPLRWETTSQGDGFGPRNRVYVPGGTAFEPDTGADRGGNPSGQVVFGPTAPGVGIGARYAQAVTEFDCGRGGACVVEIRVGSGMSGGFAQHEFLDMWLQSLDANGNPTQTTGASHAGNATSRGYRLRLRGCGRVRVTLQTRENVNASNPAGIQSMFTAHISEYSCN